MYVNKEGKYFEGGKSQQSMNWKIKIKKIKFSYFLYKPRRCCRFRDIKILILHFSNFQCHYYLNGSWNHSLEGITLYSYLKKLLPCISRHMLIFYLKNIPFELVHFLSGTALINSQNILYSKLIFKKSQC